MVAVSTEQFADQNGSYFAGESSDVGGLFNLALGKALIADAAGNIRAATIYVADDGGFALISDNQVGLPVVAASTGPLVDVDTGMAVQQPMLIAIIGIPVVEYADLDQDARNRFDDLQIPPVRKIDNAENNEFKNMEAVPIPNCQPAAPTRKSTSRTQT